jgi:hypothetical protein
MYPIGKDPYKSFQYLYAILLLEKLNHCKTISTVFLSVLVDKFIKCQFSEYLVQEAKFYKKIYTYSCTMQPSLGKSVVIMPLTLIHKKNELTSTNESEW